MSNDTREALADKCKRLVDLHVHGADLYLDNWKRAKAECHAAIEELAASLPSVPRGYIKADQAYDTRKLFEDLCDVVAEANAVDTAIGRPDVLRKKLIAIRDNIGHASNGYIPLRAPELAALTEQPAAPQASHLGDSVERCGEPSGAVSGGSASQVPHGWVSVNEMPPKPNETVLLWVEAVRYVEDGDGRRQERDESCVDFGHWQLSDGFGDPYFDNYAGRVGDAQHVTHWMPLPKPPVAMGHVGQEPPLEASVAGPEARPDKQSDSSSAAPQGVQAEPPPGFVLVPKEPTTEMLKAFWERYGAPDWLRTGYRAMLAAAPAAPAQEPQRPATREAQLRSAMERMDRDGPLPGMISAFETEFGGDWTDPSWRQETAIWAAAWRRAASSPAPAVQPEPAAPAQEPQQPAISELRERFEAVIKCMPGEHRRVLRLDWDDADEEGPACYSYYATNEAFTRFCAASSPAPAVQPCAKIFDHKWLDPECVESGCQSLVVAELVDVLKTVVAVHGLASAAIAKHGQPQGGKG